MSSPPFDVDRFREAAQFAPVGLFLTDATGQCVWVNEAWCELSGLRPEQAMGAGWTGMIHPQDLADIQARWRARVEQETSGKSEFRLLRPDGEVRWVETNSRRLRGEQGELRGHVGSLVDITDRRRHEEALRQREAALAEVTSRLESVLDATTEIAIIAVEPDQTISLFNTGAEKMLGYRASEVVGRTTPYLFHRPGDARGSRDALGERVRRRLQQIEQRPELDGPLDESEWTYVRKDGSTLPVSVTITARRDEQGRVNGYLGVAKDISAHVAAENALRQAKEAAESANRAKSEFLANVSHEIRTPLNGVLGLLELAIAEPEPASSAQLERLTLARRSAESLLLILNDLLDFAKIEAGKMQLAPRPFDLRAELGRLAQIATARAVDKGVTFRASVEALPERFVGDVDRLRQVLNNLLDNALKFTEQGEVSLAARSAPAGARQARVTFEVADTGIGIPREKIDRIFAPFEQADGSSTRRHGGTGLGLAICAELVKLMGGTLRVDSVVGQGSRFTVALLGEVRGVTSVPPPAVLATPAPLPPLRVLLVEDNPVNQIVASKMLERAGHRVWLASDGQAALDHLERDAFDLVLMDVQMPEMDGLEATRRLRERERQAGRRTPVIALTARAGAADRAEALEAGVDAYLVKPFRAAELHGAMREALEACAPPADPGPG